jgi:NAD(P)-dependent dehydrogenase (short-subunit alcohol dehydrogenase family)
MSNLMNRSAIVTGGGTGVGRATVLALAAEGARVFAVARDQKRLEQMQREAGSNVEARAIDATDPEAMTRVIGEADPDLVVLSAGVRPQMGAVQDLSWDDFSAAWNTDVKIAFETGKAALARPLRPGSLVIIVSSGAGLNGSPLSGGYAGAKRMQMFLASYLQRSSDAAKLGIRFIALVPKQLIIGTEIGEHAARTYADAAGITPEKYFARFAMPLSTDAVARSIVQIARGEIGQGAAVIGLTGQGIEVL